jgi:ABC-2 type transport system permease protein
MTAAITSEFRKFFTTRLWWGMAIGVFLAGAAFAALFALLDPTPEMTGGVDVPNLSNVSRVSSVYTGGLSVSYLLTLSIGIMTIGSEYRHKTITSTFLATPRRVKVMVAKVVSLIGIGAFYGIVSLVGAVGVGASIIAARGFSPFPSSSIWRTLALSLLVLAVWALIGLGAGILIPNQVAALLISIGLAWIIEPLVGFLIGAQSWGKGIAPYFPSNLTTAVLDTGSAAGSTFTPLAWWAAALVLTGYAAVMTLIGSVLTVRRDVS